MRGIALALVIPVLVPAAAFAAGSPTRYSLQGGCYAVADSSGKVLADKVRMQATDLGSYMLYTADRKYIAAGGNGSLAPADAPSPAADFVVEGPTGTAFTIAPKSAPAQKTAVRFTPAQGCADFPEAPLNAQGFPQKNPTQYGKVRGVVEGHMHWMTYEYIGGKFHCGKPWDAYGIQYALPDCSSIEGPQGTAAPVQNTLNYGNPAQPHDTSGYPELTSWSNNNLTYEGTYWRWIERAYLGGLRLMVMGINENRVLCELQANKVTNCNEMDTVRRGLKDIRDLQRYVDAQAGGPGKGFFQIVTDPYQARRVINEGKMAVVLEIEVSEPFDCRGWDQPSCDQAQVDKQLDEMYGDGVRSMLLLNKFDNPLTGVRFDDGTTGILINGGNKLSAGSYFSARSCPGELHDNTILSPTPSQANTIFSLLGVQGGTFPTYPDPPHCNTRGLTALGKHVVERMMDKHMIVNPDHMSQAAVSSTLDLLEARHYSGVISPHGWMDPGNWPRLWKLGGIAFPGHTVASDYVKQWQKYRPQQTPYMFGWGYGADLGGLSHQPDANKNGQISYPFKSLDGRITFERQKTGDRTFDYAKEGLSHYGLYADWFADLARQGGKQMTNDMLNGAEAYIEMWERASGIRTPGCARSDGEIKPNGFNRLRLGDNWTKTLQKAGQPQTRGRAWTYCVGGKRNRHTADVAELSMKGKVELVGSTALNRAARFVDNGQKAAAITRSSKSIGGGIRIDRTRKTNWVFATRRGKVRAVAVATNALARKPAALRAAMKRLLKAHGSQVKKTFIPNPAATAARAALHGNVLATATNPKLNAAFAYLCALQMQSYSR